MFDIHYHLLYNLDDGPKTLEESLAVAEASIRENVTHIVATPHSNSRYQFKPDEVQRQLLELTGHLGGRITLGYGCDFHLDYDNVEDAIAHPRKYTINGGSYLLIEFADHGIASGSDQAMFRLQSAGMKLIITHPERNPPILKDPGRLDRWVQSGCLVQVTADSLLGRFGKQAQINARQYIAKGWVHFVASDAHNVDKRPPRMGPAYEFVKREFNAETADRLFVSNPRAAYFNQDMPSQPNPTSSSNRGRGKFGFLGRWF